MSNINIKLAKKQKSSNPSKVRTFNDFNTSETSIKSRHSGLPILNILGGESGIRTHGTLSGTTVFKTVPFDRSGISPCVVYNIKHFFKKDNIDFFLYVWYPYFFECYLKTGVKMILMESKYGKVLIKEMQVKDLRLAIAFKSGVKSLTETSEEELFDVICLARKVVKIAKKKLQPGNIVVFSSEGKLFKNSSTQDPYCQIVISDSEKINELDLKGFVNQKEIDIIKNLFS
jgi:hypothetical protein